MAEIPIELFKDRITSIVSRLSLAAEKSGRGAEAVRILAVVKTQPVDVIQAALNAGLHELGQNRVQEAEAKMPQLEGSYTHHLIGQLQRNKARKAVAIFDVIQSVDNPRLAEALDRVAGETGKIQKCLIEVKISDEASKSGIEWNAAPDFIRSFSSYQHLSLEGLMAVGPLEASDDDRRQLYRKFADFYKAHRDRFGSKPVLSLGMSDDFEIAVEEGSSMVRLGRVLFGERRSA